MSTGHENNRQCAGKHVFATDGTITLQVSLNALVVLHGDVQADVALFAVKEILSQSSALSTDATVIAVINGLFGVIIPKLALVTIIAGHLFSTVAAILSGWLQCHTQHTHHILGLGSHNVVVLDIVMAEPTRYNLLTTIGLQFALSLVVLAS